MSYCNDIVVGELVCVKSWKYDDKDAGWETHPSDFGIVIEVIDVSYEFVFIDHKTRCFDYVIYWIEKGTIDTLPDIVIERFSDWQERQK